MCIQIELENICDYAEKINVYKDGGICTYPKNAAEFNDIADGWKEMVCGAHEMPAYGVSLNRETQKELKKGLWVEFGFGERLEHNGMPFEKLLINVQKNFQGFNIIRYNSGFGYDGRCFYYDLVNRNMDNFYDILVNL